MSAVATTQEQKVYLSAVSIQGIADSEDRRWFRDTIRLSPLDLNDVNVAVREVLRDRDGHGGIRSWVKLWVDPKIARRYQDLHNAMLETSPMEGYFTADVFERHLGAGQLDTESRIATIQMTPRMKSDGRCVFEYLLEILYQVPKD